MVALGEEYEGSGRHGTSLSSPFGPHPFSVFVCPPQSFWEADLYGLQHVSFSLTLGLVEDLSITGQEERGLCSSCPLACVSPPYCPFCQP